MSNKKTCRVNISAQLQAPEAFFGFTLRPRAAAMCAAVQPSLLAWFNRAAGSARVTPEESGVTAAWPRAGWQRRRRSASMFPERTAACRAVQPSCKDESEKKMYACERMYMINQVLSGIFSQNATKTLKVFLLFTKTHFYILMTKNLTFCSINY